VDATWDAGKITSVTVHADLGGKCRIKITDAMQNILTEVPYTAENGVLTMDTVPGGVYELKFA
jgi:hypothetical protein